MQAVHEFGHVAAAWVTGGQVVQVVLHPLTISRTELGDNPCPLLVVWAGPVLGCLLPLAAWGAAAALHCPWAFLLRFFAGFCLVANGGYIAGGAFGGLGDAGVILRNGSPVWWLVVFGAATVPAGLWLWHRHGAHFGLGAASGKVSVAAAYTCLALLSLLVVLSLVVDGE
jgi:hypothetical protein